MIATVVLAFAVVAVSQAVVAGQMQTADALYRSRALQLGEALMEEAVRLPYCDPDDDPCGASGAGPDAGETGRSEFDNADDFHGFSESAGALADAAGTTYSTPFQVFDRSVTAVIGNVSVTDLGNPLPGLTLTVTVQDAAGTTWTLTRFKAEPPS